MIRRRACLDYRWLVFASSRLFPSGYKIAAAERVRGYACAVAGRDAKIGKFVMAAIAVTVASAMPLLRNQPIQAPFI